ncbi:phage tail spike protein [Clostridium perfringens]|uniref:phage tail spike protein n=1 Tax=Clostridium perfringens TaxID=1502 RepID=UPI0010E9D3AA|nr:phage tail spike protein [Clostridium perfringens]VTQ55191.1 KID repeat-containing protein [Clostridium perfringens]
MIELRDKDKNRVAGLVDYENLCIESVLESGDKTLSFYYPKKGKYYDEIVEEAYIRTKKDEFVVKARELDEDYTKFECSLNLEELEGNIFDRFESVEQTITSALNLAVVGTGWTVKDNTLKKRRTVRCTNKSSLEIVREIKKVYRVDIVFNTLEKQIEVYENLGEDKGTYFIDSLNLIALQVQSDSRQYATRIIAEGKDGLSFSDINNGKNYVENYQYSNKVKTIYWKDERYSVKESLLEDARAKLEELSKPFRSYSASILNLAELNPRYSSILDFELGDAINLISKKNKIKDKQRIVKIIEWPQDHTKDSVELANATLKFEDIQQENQETSDTVSNITTDNGTINGSTIDSIQVKQIENFEANVLKVTKLEVIEARIDHLSVIKADIQDLNVVKANIGTLEATKANITELNSIRADLQQAIIGKANITDLNAAVGKIHVLESKTASIENALLGNLTAENFKANAITAGSAVIAEGAIGSSQISSLSVNKLEAGDITTSKHRIVSADGTIEIVGNQILINRNNVNRVILGEYRKSDGTTEYGLLVRAKDGQTIMLDGNGVHNAGITDGAIDNNKVADNANISGNKLDINSVIREVNNNGTETIKGTKVTVGDRTLDVELSTQKNTITEHSKELSSQKASLTALDNAIKLKVDSQTFTQSTTTINNNITRAKEEAINTAKVNINDAISDLDIGIYNLALESGNFTDNTGSLVVNGGTLEIDSNNKFRGSNTLKIKGNSGICYKDYIELQGNTTYCYSCWIKSDRVITLNSGAPLHMWVTESKEDDVCHREIIIKYSKEINSNWQQAFIIFKTPSKKEKYLMKPFIYGIGEATVWLANFQVKKGSVLNDWTINPNDLKKYSDDVAKAKSDLAKTEAIANADGKITEEERKRIQQAQENLNLAIAKAEKAKQDAINTASTDATNKANNALNSAKAYTNTEITTVNTHLNKATAEINVLKEKIELKVGQSDIDKSIEDVKFGDRNLFPESYLGSHGCAMGKWNNPYMNIPTYNIVVNRPNQGNNFGFNIKKPIKINGGKGVTFTFLFNYIINKYTNSNSSNMHGYTRVYYKDGSKQDFDFNSKIVNCNDKSNWGKWISLKFTFTTDINKEIDNIGLFYFYTDGASEGTNFDFTIPKLVIGNKIGDWTPAPEDTDQLIIDNIKTVTDKISTVESNLTQKTNSIEAGVRDLNSTTQSITTNVSNINRDLTSKINSNLNAAKSFATDIATNKANTAKQEAISSANSHADSIAASKANEALNNSKAYTNEQINTVNTKVHNVESNLSILSDKISTKVSQSDIDKSIKEIELGGRNLILKSDVELEGTSPKDIQVGKLSDTQFITGKTVTVSLDLECEDLNGGNRVGYEMALAFEDGSTQYIGCWYYVGSSPKTFNGRISSVWNVKKGRIINIHYSGLYIQCSGKKIKIGRPKIELGNKATDWTPAPEDFNVLVADNIKVVNSKISDVSSSVTQLRDSVTTDIRAINSKTQSIETTLNGKASKQEVTEVNNRVATIKASLDSITQRVSSTESKTQTLETNLNGKASKQEVVNITSRIATVETNLSGITSRVSSTETVTKSLNDKLWEATNKLNNVEQRITPISIINTVSSAYYKKGEVDNVFSTKSEVEQLDNRINYKFSNTGYSNLIFNGNFANGTVHWRNWGNCSLVSENGQLTVRAKQSSNNANIGAVSSTFVLEKGKKYSLTFQCCSSWNIPWLNYIYLLGEDGVNHRLDLRIDINSADLVYRTATFTAPATKWVRLLIGVEGYLQTDVSGFKLVDVCLVEGDIPRRFVPNANEISEGATSIDSNGVIVRHTNGSYTSMTLGGFEWKTKGMSKAYHCLAETGWVNISTGAWLGDHYDIKITLPEYFRGKVFTPCSMIQGWYVESNFSLNQLVVNIPYETINYSEGSFVIRVKALTRDGVFQRNINISWLAIA